jgi:hypothetical protein
MIRQKVIEAAKEICRIKNGEVKNFKVTPSDKAIEDLTFGWLVRIWTTNKNGEVIIGGFGAPGIYVRKRDYKGFIMIYGEFVSISMLRNYDRLQRKRINSQIRIKARHLAKLMDWFELDEKAITTYLIDHNINCKYNRKGIAKLRIDRFPPSDTISRFV